MKKVKAFVMPALGIFFLLVVWEVLARMEIWPEYVLPKASDVAKYLWDSTLSSDLPSAVWVTLKRLLLGYGIGLLVGIPLGLLCARVKFFQNSLGTLALGLQALPSVCWVPLAIIWFGQTENALLFVVLMGTVWSLILGTQHGVANIPPIYIRAARTMGSHGLKMWGTVILPAAFPNIVGGMKQGWAFAWRSLMAAEIYVTILTGFGVGQLLHYGRELNNMTQVIGIMIVVVIIGLLADKILFSPWERMLRRRWGMDIPSGG